MNKIQYICTVRCVTSYAAGDATCLSLSEGSYYVVTKVRPSSSLSLSSLLVLLSLIVCSKWIPPGGARAPSWAVS